MKPKRSMKKTHCPIRQGDMIFLFYCRDYCKAPCPKEKKTTKNGVIASPLTRAHG
jgi:hypothetical protein